MRRYYFIIDVPDYTYDDPEGEHFLSQEAAREYGHQIIRELEEGGFESAGAVLHITDESGHTIHSIPFWMVPSFRASLTH
jgi:hypothetical protein